MISSTNRKAGPFAGNGVTIVFPFAFKVFAASDVQVVSTTSNVDTVLASGFVTALNGDQNVSPGGTVTFTVAPATGTRITLLSVVASTQGVELTNNGGFFPNVLNDAFDRETILAQQLEEKMGRTLVASPASTNPYHTLPASMAGQVLGQDLTGAWVGVASDGLGTTLAAQTAAAAALADRLLADADRVQTGLDRVQTGLDRVQTGVDVTSANASASGASGSLAAVIAAMAAGTIRSFASTADALSNGVIGYVVTSAGSGGTNGSYALTMAGGAGSGAAAKVLVASGALVISPPPTIQQRGKNYTSAPTVSFTVPGLTGSPAITAIIGANTVDGDWFSVPDTPNSTVRFYKNVAAAAVLQFSLPRFSGTIADRGALVTASLINGQQFYVTDINPPRMFVWVTAGSKDPFGATVVSDGWVGLYTLSEIKNLGIDFTNTLPSANVQSLPGALTDITALAAIKIGGFDARALSSTTNPTVDLSWGVSGVRPSAQSVTWSGYTVLLDGGIRRWSPPVWTNINPLFVVGNSLSDSSDVSTRWSQLYSAARGVTLLTVAKYSSDARMIYRTGAVPLYLTVASNILTAASGSPAVVTAINGNAPSADASAHPESFLNQAVGTSNTTNCSMTGWALLGSVARHVTVAIPNDGSTAYTIAQDSGALAVTVTGPVLFIPDITLRMATSDLVIWMGNNYFYSGVPNFYGDYTNPTLWVDMALIVARAQGQRIQILPVLPDASWTTTGTGNPYTAMQAANARTEALYPRYFARDTAGRTLLQRLQANGDGSANDNADIAAGFTPRSLRTDTLHLNSAGDAIVATFLAEHRAVQSAPPAVTQSTVFTMQASGTQPGTSTALSDASATRVRLAPGAV